MNNEHSHTPALSHAALSAGALLLAGSQLLSAPAFADSDVTIRNHYTPVVIWSPNITCSEVPGQFRDAQGDFLASNMEWTPVTAGRERQTLGSGYAEFESTEVAYASMSMLVGQRLHMNADTPELLLWQNDLDSTFFVQDMRAASEDAADLDSSSKSSSIVMVEQRKTFKFTLESRKRIVFDAGIETELDIYVPDWAQNIEPFGEYRGSATMSSGHGSVGGARIEVGGNTIWSGEPGVAGFEEQAATILGPGTHEVSFITRIFISMSAWGHPAIALNQSVDTVGMVRILDLDIQPISGQFPAAPQGVEQLLPTHSGLFVESGNEFDSVIRQASDFGGHLEASMDASDDEQAIHGSADLFAGDPEPWMTSDGTIVQPFHASARLTARPASANAQGSAYAFSQGDFEYELLMTDDSNLDLGLERNEQGGWDQFGLVTWVAELENDQQWREIQPDRLSEEGDYKRYRLEAGKRYRIGSSLAVFAMATSEGQETIERSIAEAFEIRSRFRIPGDINGDGSIDGADLSGLLGAWGTSDLASDVNGDGSVNGQDLATLLGNWND